MGLSSQYQVTARFSFSSSGGTANVVCIPEIELPDIVFVEKPSAGVFHHHSAGLQHIAVIGGLQRHIGILLDQEDADTALAVDPHDDLEDVSDEPGRQAERRLVQQHHLRARHQCPADRKHLLLAARELAGALIGSLLQYREIAVDHFQVPNDAVPVLAGVALIRKLSLTVRNGTPRPSGTWLRPTPIRSDPCAGSVFQQTSPYPLRVHHAGHGLRDVGLSGAIAPRMVTILPSARRS
jgi:hypothetical protein